MLPNTARRVEQSIDQFDAALAAWVLETSPDALVLIGQRVGQQLQAGITTQLSDACPQRYDSLSDWIATGHSPPANALVLVSVAQKDLTQLQNRQVGALCRAFPQGVLIVDYAASSKSRQQFFANGFIELLACQQPEKNAAAYLYQLRNYKPAPSWLNSKYWAHPERFDLPPE
ncbi:MAG: hypothetical protein KTR35_06650 [Gammaproteobacteria bacterium]|nr:hypothetical protein [Gammaproteobacteria bacterium]